MSLAIVTSSPWSGKIGKATKVFADARNIPCQLVDGFKADDVVAAVDFAAAAVFLIEEADDDKNGCLSELESRLAAMAPLTSLSYYVICADTSDSGARLEIVLKAGGADALLPTGPMPGEARSFEIWMTKLWACLASSKLGMVSSFPLKYRVEDKEEPSPSAKPKSFHRARVVENKLLTPPDYLRPSYLLTIDFTGTDLSYETGDHVVIMPENQPENVDRMLKCLSVDGGMCVEVLSAAGERVEEFPSLSLSIGDVLKYYVDIQGLATRRFLAMMSLLATDVCEAEKLADWATSMSAESPYSTLARGQFSYLDVLEKFPSIRLTLAQALSAIPNLRPRSYSACCSPLIKENQVQIVYTVVSYPLADKSMFVGTNTRYMSGLRKQDSINMTLRKGYKKLHMDRTYVGVALGSGVSMLRGISQHLDCLRAVSETATGSMLLYYGTRHEKEDFLFGDELKEYAARGTLILKTAFSHDQEQFITPADRMKEDPETLCRALVDKQDSHFVYCGPTGAAYKCIEEGIIYAIKSARPEIDPMDVIKKMHNEHRWEAQGYAATPDPENPFNIN